MSTEYTFDGLAALLHEELVNESYFTDMTNEGFAGYGVKNCEVVRYDF